MACVSWSDEDKATVERLWRMGHSATEIGRVLGRTRCSVLGAASRMNLLKNQQRVQVSVRVRSSKPKEQASKAVARTSVPEVADPAPPVKSFPVTHSRARPWLQRRFNECAYPVSGYGDAVLSCCAPVSKGYYCKAHRKVMYYKAPVGNRRVSQSV